MTTQNQLTPVGTNERFPIGRPAEALDEGEGHLTEVANDADDADQVADVDDFVAEDTAQRCFGLK